MGLTSFDLGLIEQVMMRAPAGMAVITREGRFLVVNPAYAALYGYQPEELLGRPFTQLFVPGQRAAVQARHEAFIDGHGPFDGELEVVHRDGRSVTVQVQSVRLWAEGLPCRMVSVHDITQRKRMESELRTQRQFLLRVLDGLSAHVAVLDAQGDIVIVNRAWRAFGLSQGLPADTVFEGSSYLQASAAAATREGGHGATAEFLARLHEVLDGRLAGFEHQYPCHAPGKKRWFVARVSRLDDVPGARAVVAHDEVTEQVLAQEQAQAGEAALRASEETYRTLFETVPQGVVYQDRKGRITSANPAAQRILGLTLAQLQGRESADPRWQAVREDGSHCPGAEHPSMQALRTGQPVRDVVLGVQAPGRGTVWLLVSAVPLFKEGRLHEVYSTFEDITQRIHLGRELERQALTDELTGVASRRAVLSRLQAEFERLRRYPGHCCALLALDLDHFKAVNDTYGHAAGDAVLRQVARVAAGNMRAADLLGRTGGEEFLVVLPDTAAPEAEQLAGRLCQEVAAQATCFDGQAIPMTLSVGVTALRPDDAHAESALRRADQALYAAKTQGRNQVCVALT